MTTDTVTLTITPNTMDALDEVLADLADEGVEVVSYWSMGSDDPTTMVVTATISGLDPFIGTFGGTLGAWSGATRYEAKIAR